MFSEDQSFWIPADVFRDLGFLDIGSRFQRTKGFLGFGSCFQRTKVSGSWLIFLEAYDFGAWLMISEVQGAWLEVDVDCWINPWLNSCKKIISIINGFIH